MTQVSHRVSRGLLALFAVLLVAASALIASPAAAHDRLIGSDPAAGATVDESPAQLTLTFSGVISPDAGASEVQVTDAAGTQLAGDPVAADNTLTVPLVAQGEGAVTVLWKVVSSDGHPISGEYGFTVTAAAPEPAPEPTETAETSPTTEPSAPVETAEPAETETPVTEAPSDAADMTPWIIAGIVVLLAVVGGIIYLVASRARRAKAAQADSANTSER
ncbi:copper resistance protein CopC [Microbacterium sp. NPDC055910]|uniref:copper resistance CopC family protein n=1 Tax=Microbacterium sp. NPDC055910 TaxID=3345659 RepID=UPI0035D6390E